jgi:hypothetical protein
LHDAVFSKTSLKLIIKYPEENGVKGSGISKYILILIPEYLLLIALVASGHELDKSFQYISPIPGASLVSRETSIILRPGEILESRQSYLDDIAEIRGSSSGDHSYKTIVADDEKTIILTPDKAFEPGETVAVFLKKKIGTIGSGFTATGSFSFNITPLEETICIDDECEESFEKSYHTTIESTEAGNDVLELDNRDVSLPSDFPGLTVSAVDNPDDGYVFMAKHRPTGPTYLLILDNDANPVYYKKLPTVVTDFKKQRQNLLSYYQYGTYAFTVMDSTYTIIDSYVCRNGYLANHHDFQMIDSGHVLLIAYDTQIIDMSIIVPGGDPGCLVTGLIIQELDSQRNVVFQWRSWDHFEITDATHADFQGHRIDYVHGNAIELDNDGNLLLSSRHLEEITKINRQTGDIIWRLGGNNNEFSFVGDTSGFSYQHDIRRIANGNITLFDNGNWHTPQFSRAVEYQLDEVNKVCTLVWEYRYNPDIWGAVNGSVQRLPNGNTMIGWGGPSPVTLTEIGPDSTIEFELSYDNAPSTWTYRAFRFPWHGIAAVPHLIVETGSDYIHLIFNKFGDDNVVKYYIYGDTIPQPIAIIDSTENSFADLYDLIPGEVYHFRVTAVDSFHNECPFSNEVFALMPGEGRLPYLPGDANMLNGQWQPQLIGSDVTYLVGYFRGLNEPCLLDNPPFYCAADANGDCLVIGSDVTKIVNYFRDITGIDYCPDYPPAWLTPADLPENAPVGWPNCNGNR